MEYLQVAIRLLLAGLIAGPAAVFAGATGGRKISFAASSPAGELAAPSHKTMSQTTWYQNRGPATSGMPTYTPLTKPTRGLGGFSRFHTSVSTSTKSINRSLNFTSSPNSVGDLPHH